MIHPIGPIERIFVRGIDSIDTINRISRPVMRSITLIARTCRRVIDSIGPIECSIGAIKWTTRGAIDLTCGAIDLTRGAIDLYRRIKRSIRPIISIDHRVLYMHRRNESITRRANHLIGRTYLANRLVDDAWRVEIISVERS